METCSQLGCPQERTNLQTAPITTGDRSRQAIGCSIPSAIPPCLKQRAVMHKTTNTPKQWKMGSTVKSNLMNISTRNPSARRRSSPRTPKRRGHCSCRAFRQEEPENVNQVPKKCRQDVMLSGQSVALRAVSRPLGSQSPSGQSVAHRAVGRPHQCRSTLPPDLKTPKPTLQIANNLTNVANGFKRILPATGRQPWPPPRIGPPQRGVDRRVTDDRRLNSLS